MDHGYSKLNFNLLAQTRRKTTPKIVKIKNSGQRIPNPVPFRKMSLRMIRKYFAGMKVVAY